MRFDDRDEGYPSIYRLIIMYSNTVEGGSSTVSVPVIF